MIRPREGVGATPRGERGMPGGPCPPRRGWEGEKNTRLTPRDPPAFPHAMVLTAASSSPRRPGFVATIAGEISFTNLTPASGRQDHTTSPSASQHSRQQRRLRPSHPLPYVRDDRETPLVCGPGWKRHRSDLGQKRTEIFLRGGTGQVASG